MYARIENRRSVRKLYTETLVNRGDLTVEDAERFLEEFQEELKRAFDETRRPAAAPALEWKRPAAFGPIAPVETGVDRETLRSVLDAITSWPEGFHVHKRLVKWLDGRRGALDEDAVDWALAESLAWGSLILEGTDVRLSGQDSRRGTFSQRNSVLVDQETGAEHAPLAHLPGARGRFLAYDSLLSEYAALGFEYGYSVAAPDSLVMWEAQFGDFVNGAQVVIDGFMAAAEDKWGQTSRLVLLLPHGYEGQGPEHSSARLERFLALGAEDNIQVVVPSTPAQYFHVLRRQVRQSVAKPLVVLTPKSLLRHPAARSPADALASGRFRKVLADPLSPEPAEVSRVILCQGKVFYDLAQRREEATIGGSALVRVEQLYPFPAERIKEQLDCYSGADEVFWVQEEPENMGAWRFMHLHCERRLGVNLSVVAREESASPATGSKRIHEHEQNAILEGAFAGLKAEGK
jgi:2-oxoglutarate dehydrogenase complex dehydrogenase (E1) component-like enzyme